MWAPEQGLPGMKVSPWSRFCLMQLELTLHSLSFTWLFHCSWLLAKFCSASSAMAAWLLFRQAQLVLLAKFSERTKNFEANKDLWGSSPAAITSVLWPCRCYGELHLVFLRAAGPCPDGQVRARCQAGNSEWLSPWQVLHWLVHVATPSPRQPGDASLWNADKMETLLSIPVITWVKI